MIEAAAPALKLIARSGVGYNSIDVAAAKASRVWVTTTIGSNHDAVADYTLGLILDLARRISQINAQTKSRLVGPRRGDGAAGQDPGHRRHRAGRP